MLKMTITPFSIGAILGMLVSGDSLIQAQFPFGQPAGMSEEIFLMAPRPLTRLLREGESAIQEERYADGISALMSLLLEDSDELPEDIRGQDYFIDDGVRGLFNKSVKGEAIRLLGELPAEGRRTLQVQYGVTAQRELEQAISSRSFELLADVARKFVHTEAGYDAQLLLARSRLAQGFPLAAASQLQDLLDYPAARSRYGTQLAKTAAAAWQLAGNIEMAALTLKLAARDFPGESIDIEGRRIPLENDTDWRTILGRIDLDSTLSVARASDSWLTYGGNSQRNAVSDVGMPLANARWVREIHSSLPEKEALSQLEESAQQQGRVLLPKFELRMLDNLVLTKTTDAFLLCIDFETGNIRWPFYFNASPFQLTSDAYSLAGGGGGISQELQNRVWGSSAFGSFSCDHERFYFVSDVRDQSFSERDQFGNRSAVSDTNFLEGVSIPAEGTLLWRVGGASGEDEPRLANAYFLGPPLAYQDELYCVIEVNGETKLVVLEAATGKLRWTQQLVHSMAPALQYDPQRKSQALSPTISDGVVLCPTGAGAIVAVDMINRSLRWGVSYMTNRNDGNSALRQRGAFGYGADYSPLERRWNSAHLIVQNGVVVATPPDSQDLFCRDVLTGAPRLAPQRAGAGRYVAGLRNENVVVVGERSITAVQLGTGKSAWECNYPSGLTLAGSGVWQTDSLLLPLSSQTVIRVSTDDGRIIDQIRVDQPLGNLYVHKDQLLSVSATAVSAFYTREALAEQVATKLAANPEDTWALTQRSQLALAENNLELAISSLTKSYELDPASADTRYLLVEALLRGLEIDFSSFEAIAQQYEDKIEFGPQRFRFLQQLALGKIRSGQPLAAFESLLELVPEVGNSFLATQHRPKLLELESEYTVDSNHWIAAELARAFANATQDDRRRMAELVALQLQTLDGVMVPLRREKLQYLQWLPDASEDLLDLAQELLGDDEQTIAEQLLQPLLFSSTASPSIQKARELIARPASADLQMMGPAGNRITPSYAADEQFESMRPKANASAANLDTAEVKWNSGRLQVKASRDGRYQFGATVDADSQRWGRPEFRVALSGSLVVVSNGNGEDIGHFEYPRASNDSSDVFTRATIRGGLLLIETGPEIAMFDVYRGLNSSADALLWRHSLFSPGTGPTREFQVPGHSSVNTPLGFTINRRQMPGSQQAIVGPLTPVGVLVQIGTRVIMLDALTGRAVWSRDGYDDNTRMTARDLEVAIVNPSLGSTQILDCRDGAILRKDKYEGDWRNWFSHNALMVDFSDSQTLPPQPGSLRVWDAITGREVQRLELSPGARADESERRYLVVYEPNSKLHYFDLENPDQVVYHLSQTKPQKNIATVSAERFQDRVVVLTSASKVQSDISDYVAHGDVYCLDAHTGEQQWTKPGQLFNMQIPKSQPRESPFLVAYRINQRVGNVSRATLAIIDLRSGRIAFSSNLLPLSASVGFAMTLRPLEQLIEMGLGARSLSFTVTDEPVPPQPIFVFGLTAKSASNPSELDGIFSDR